MWVDEATAWRVLSAEADEVVVVGHLMPTLALPARAMYVALHAAQHGRSWDLTIADLERALAACDDDRWVKAAALADEPRATAAFLAGLRLVPAGKALLARLALADVRLVEAELRVGLPPPLALGFEELARAPGMRARAEMVWRKLAPTPEFLRDSDPSAADGHLGLAQAYVRRVMRLSRHASRGLVAWYSVRRLIRRGELDGR